MTNYGHMATIVAIFPKADGSFGMAAARLTYKAGASIVDSFDVAVDGEAASASLAMDGNRLILSIITNDMAASVDQGEVVAAAIASQYINGTWRYSNAEFVAGQCDPSFDEAIATYPIGQARFLNGEGANEGGDTPSPTPTEYAVTLGQTTDSTGGDSVTLTGDGNYAEGDSVTVEAEYDGPSGTNFDGWYDAASGGTKKSSNESYTFTMPGAPVALYAKYV